MGGLRIRGNRGGCSHLFSRDSCKPLQVSGSPGLANTGISQVPPTFPVSVSRISSFKLVLSSLKTPYCLLPASTAPSALPNVVCGGHFLCAPSRVVLCYGYFSFWDGEMQHREVQQFLHSLTAKNKDWGRVFVLSLACSALEPTPDCI